MTYCIGVMLNDGLIFASDSRTNAGVDNVAKFCKMTVFEIPGNRVIVLLSSGGNLAGTQAIVSVLTQRCADGAATTNLLGATTMFDVARLVSDAMRETEERDAKYLNGNAVGFNASFIVGGQLAGEPMRLFRIYAEATSSRPGRTRCFYKRGGRRSTASRSSIVSSHRTRRWLMPRNVFWFPLIRPCAATYRWECRSTSSVTNATAWWCGGGDSTTRTRTSPPSGGRRGAKVPARCSAGCPNFIGDGQQPCAKTSLRDRETI